jgi:hypothetical protein
MAGIAASSAVAEATMTESPMAVTCRPDTFGSRAAVVRHANAGDLAAETGPGDAGPGDAGAGDAGAGDAAGGVAPAVAWDAALIRWPSATWRSSPDGAADAGGRATP